MTIFVVRVPADVLVQQLPDDELVFLNLATAEYYGLDAIGTAMWAALAETGRTDLALDRLLEEFDIDEGTLSRDLDSFLALLVGKGLIHLADQRV